MPYKIMASCTHLFLLIRVMLRFALSSVTKSSKTFLRSPIVKLDLAGIFYPVLEGRKTPLRIRYKARVMTGDDVTKCPEEQHSYNRKIAEEKKR